jgi:hypothetical protein
LVNRALWSGMLEDSRRSSGFFLMREQIRAIHSLASREGSAGNHQSVRQKD